jgi:hypothetical protein
MAAIKLTLALFLVPAISSFVIPDEQVLSLLPEKISQPSECGSETDDVSKRVDDKLSYALDVASNVHVQSDHRVVDFLEFGVDEELGYDHWLPDIERGDRGHDGPNRTIYQLISESEHSTKFAKLVNKFDDVVEYLNSTSTKYTVFVPADRAFEKFKKAPTPSDEYLKKLIYYHVSPDFSPVRSVFISRTLPTFLKEKELGSNPARISTQFGLHGLTINFIAHIIKADIVSENTIGQFFSHF